MHSHWADERGAPSLEGGLHRDRQPALVLDVDLEVVLEVLADARDMGDRLDAQGLELVRVAHARELQQLGRVEGTAGQDHGAAVRLLDLAPAGRVLHANRARALEQDAADEGARDHLEVATANHRVQVGA
jgi:hypothetical protein